MSPTVATATRDRLRIAIQKSGRLAEPARALLSACGLSSIVTAAPPLLPVMRPLARSALLT